MLYKRNIESFDELKAYIERKEFELVKIRIGDVKEVVRRQLEKEMGVVLNKKKYRGIKRILNLYIVRRLRAKLIIERAVTYKSTWLYKLFWKQKDEMKEKQMSTYVDFINHIAEYEDVYKMIDKESKEVFLKLLMLRLTGNIMYAEEIISTNTQYFPSKFTWCDKVESICDCGAYVGDTLAAFIDANIRISDYYAFELDPDNYSQLDQIAKSINVKNDSINIRTYNKGVYNENTKIFFVADNDSSKIVDYETEIYADVVCIDSIVSGPISYIKMDIEGSELAALEGAKATIRQYRPKLAICIYHKTEDYWKIPLYIREICPEYNHYWIEHHDFGYYETVLYVAEDKEKRTV